MNKLSIPAVHFVKEIRTEPGITLRKYDAKNELHSFDPFVLLYDVTLTSSTAYDYHPHGGFQDGTYVVEGELLHEDSCGNSIPVQDGGFLMMTAGRGILHMISSNEVTHEISLWINLSSKDKMAEAAAEHIAKEDVSTFSDEGVTAKVLLGDSLGLKSKISSITSARIVDFKMDPGSKHVQSITQDWTTFIYCFAGEVFASGVKVSKNCAGLFGPGDRVEFENKGNEPARFIFASGKPVQEPVYVYREGHAVYVMNSESDARQAHEDFCQKRNRFQANA